jgi:hypothetical protein
MNLDPRLSTASASSRVTYPYCSSVSLLSWLRVRVHVMKFL